MQTPFRAAGSLEADYAAVDWAATPLGPVEGWTRTLRGALDTMLHTQLPATLLWGQEFVLLYNEAYLPVLGDKHPALGSPCARTFPEAWDALLPIALHVIEGHPSTLLEDALVPLNRRGFLEESYFTYCYSAVRNTDGVVEGILDLVTETTARVHSQRRLLLLGQLEAELAAVQDADLLVSRVLPILRASADLAGVEVRLPGRPVLDPDPRLADLPGPHSDLVDVELMSGADGRVVRLPLASPRPGVAPGSVLLLLNDQVPADESCLRFLRLVAQSLTGALRRLDLQDAERRAAQVQRQTAEAFQRSLLHQPASPEQVQVAVRYQPAAEQLQVGGDWYDAFRLPDGTVVLVVGDVTGHDQDAAITMAQLRNTARGIAFALPETRPSTVLRQLDRAMAELTPDVLATALVATLTPDGLLRWSNAGHPPPVLLGPDGASRLLDAEPNLLLGLDGVAPRDDHEVALAPGSGLVLFTDGLVERRGVSVQRGLDWLVDELSGRSALSAEQLCDHLLAAVDHGLVEDDVAILVVRV